MPATERSLGRLVRGSPTEVPLTMISPCWKGSSALTVLISVDLPEPDGPQTTTTSPLATAVVQASSTWKDPYHLLTCLISIIGGFGEACIVAPVDKLAQHAGALFQPLDQPRGGEADQEIHQRHEQIELHQPAVALADLGGRAQESVSDSTYTSDVSWNRMMTRVSSAGIMLRKACGSTT